MKATLLVVTLNEIDGMRAIMPRVKPEWCDQILLLDGGSTDGTIEYAQQNGYEVYLQKEPGIRFAYREVWERIRGDVVITFSPDGNSIPELIPDLLLKMEEGYDMAIASRYFQGARSEDDDWVTGFGNWLFTKTINLLHRARYSDAMVIFRAYKTELPRELGLMNDRAFERVEKLFRTRVSWEPLLSVRAARARKKITEIPGDEPPRIGGTRKLQVLKWGAAYYTQFFLEAFSGKRSWHKLTLGDE